MRLPDGIIPAASAQLQTVCECLHTLLGEEIVGIYLHGSLAMGCFHPHHSDLDLLVVTRHRMSVDRKQQVMALLLRLSNAPFPIEISFLVFSEIHPFEHPLPFDLHYSEMWREQTSRELAEGTRQRWNEESRRDPDLTAHVMITRHRGLTLSGKPIPEVFPLVPDEAYALSILGDYHDARASRKEHLVYFVLNACRVHAFLENGKILSKEEGGRYGLTVIPGQFHPLIRQALASYRGAVQLDAPFEESRLDAFAAFMDQAPLGEQQP